MQEKNSLNANLVLKNLKKALKTATDIQLSEFLNIKPNTISTWKKRNSLDYATIIAICELHEIDLNEIFLNKPAQKHGKDYSSETPLINREQNFQYCVGDRDGLLGNVPRFNFPFVRGEDTRAFQVTSNNMYPLIEENSFVVCDKQTLESIGSDAVVVIVSKTKGMLLGHLKKTKMQGTYALGSESKLAQDVTLNTSDINEVWLVRGMLSYNINVPHHHTVKPGKVTQDLD